MANERRGWLRRAMRPTAKLLGSGVLLGIGILLNGASESEAAVAASKQALGDMVILGYNDLGMHCMGSRFGEICILPPANTMRATVINRSGPEPEIVNEGLTISYSIPGNTTSANKTDFWTYAPALFGVNLAPNMGLFGKGMTGVMDRTLDDDWIAPGIPVTPLTDSFTENAYQLATLVVRQDNIVKAATSAVIPVSWEMHCDYCHNTPGITPETDILRKHDRLHGTNLENEKPVLCARCHADPALGAPGKEGVSNLSHAMHNSHANRKMPGMAQLVNICYACHPGPKTQCMRDMHRSKGNVCVKCHGGMAAVANPMRRPWQDEPKCSNCHNVAGHQYEEPGKLYRDSKGHGGVKCEACHGSPHAITPTVQPNDNVQAIALQGHSGTINKCTVCHSTQPNEAFFHSREH